ncbi:MAG: hypothetical protein GH151_04195 [Bacteroidetes bacterium]|nr:hypothetical protein [Bacteroidota bacterium]
MSECEHKNIEFLGIQKTLDANKFLYLFNCKTCGSTIAIDKRFIITLFLAILEDHS